MRGTLKVPVYAKFDGEEYHVGDWDIRIEGDYIINNREEGVVYQKVVERLQAHLEEADD